METQNNYKRTVAGSVGAGMGALFNGSGRTYYILEHKTSSKYHQAGETQKIIIDQIELGRDASCQVRFDESLDTVSRKHAAIVKEGTGWKLIHLSQSNPTLVNGQPIQGQYFLQSGDEIQLSVGGPRMGFIQPQGAQAMTSSIKFTERMNLFRQQALRPYRTAIWVLSALLLLAILGFGAWNYKLSLDNQELRKEMVVYQTKLDSLAAVKQSLLQEEEQLNQELETATGAKKEEIKQRIVYVQSQLSSVASQAKSYQQKLATVTQQATEQGMDEDEITSIAPSSTEAVSVVRAASNGDPDAGIAGETGSIAGEEVVADGATQTNVTAHGDASMTIRDYYNHIYSLKIRRISVERDGRSFDPGISLSDVICGTAFVLSNGTLVTARQNIEPWIFWRQLGGKWRKLMAEYISLGCNVIIDYDAYSTSGTAHKLSFNNQDFLIDRSGDIITETIEISKEVRVNLKDNGIELEGKNTKSSSISVFSPRSQCFALLRGKGGVGIPYDAGASLSSDGGTEVQVAGFKNNPDIHNLAAYISYFKSSTSRTDTQNGTIVLQDANSNAGYLGSPAFIKEEDGSYRVIGLMVGNLFGEDRLVPIARCNK